MATVHHIVQRDLVSIRLGTGYHVHLECVNGTTKKMYCCIPISLTILGAPQFQFWFCGQLTTSGLAKDHHSITSQSQPCSQVMQPGDEDMPIVTNNGQSWNQTLGIIGKRVWEIGLGGSIPSGMYGIRNYQFIPTFIWNFQLSMGLIRAKLCSNNFSHPQTPLFSISWNYTSVLWFVFPINACRHAIMN